VISPATGQGLAHPSGFPHDCPNYGGYILISLNV
jgi:hypothetical protein